VGLDIPGYMSDAKIDIAIGRASNSKLWRNQKWTWEDLSDKLLAEYKTTERFKEFIAANKQEQHKIKDVGGYVGGYLRQGRRKPQNVAHRQLITLDIDYAHSNFWRDFQMQFDNTAVLHGTHKHTEASPRYRLVMPLSRECSPDEYEATARAVAGVIGIDLFDNTGFQPERLMFWPSTSSDMVYYAVKQDGPWLDVDEILGQYVDWTDSSAWPMAESAIKEVREGAKKQQDPEEKKGIVGTFCRTYSITEAIETFLSEEYKPAGDGRFTYSKGSAAGGLVIYEDKFAYSHHGTDPVGSQLSNAFDLVRVHKFGHLDKGTPVNGRPQSYLAMTEHALADKGVKRTLAAERISGAHYDFADGLDPEEASSEPKNIEWATELEADAKGNYLATAGNISLILANDDHLKGAFKENRFDAKKYVVKSVPWRKVLKPEPLKNVDFSGVRNYIESVYGIAHVSKIDDSLLLEFDKSSFHPIEEFIEGLEWDGVERVDRLLVDYFGADDNIYTREAMRKMLVGAIARVLRPGIKFDLVLTLVGTRQGTGKSTFISKLGGEWFSDSFHTVNGKEAFEQLHGAWLIEIAELSGLRKSEVEAIKHFITKQEDIYRPAYGRIQEAYKRQCVFFATTNEKDFLRDPSGNRRFLPVNVKEHLIKKSVFSKEFDESIPQIWAEAKALHLAGEPLFLSKKAELIARGAQREHNQIDDREGLVLEYLDRLLPDNWEDLTVPERRNYLEDDLSPRDGYHRQQVCTAEIWCECLGKDRNDMDRYKTRDVNEILRGLEDWEPASLPKVIKPYGKQRYFQRKLF
jgi:putative DNA primase/helicase